MPDRGRCSKIERGRCQEGSRWRSARGRIDRQTRKIGSRMALGFNGFRLVRLLGTYTAPGVDRRCFRHQLLLPSPYLVLTKPLRLDIQCQRAASVKIGWKYLDD